MTFSIPQGGDKDLEISGLGDLTGCTGYLAVREHATNGVVIEKSTANVGDGEIVGDPTEGVLRFHFIPPDTNSLVPGPVGSYSFDSWILTPSGKHFQVRWVSVFIVTPRVVTIP